MPRFIFEYALVSPEGLYYTGMAGKDYVSPHLRDAFTYTLNGAHVKMAKSPWAKNFTIEKVV